MQDCKTPSSLGEARGGKTPEFLWLAPARWVAAGVLVAGAWFAGALDYVESAWPLLAVGLCVGLYNILQVRARDLLFWSRSLLFLDIASLTACLHFSGDIENPIRSAYALPVVAASLVLRRRSAYLLAGTSLALFALLLACTYWEGSPFRLPHRHLELLSDSALHDSVARHVQSGDWGYFAVHVLYLAVLLFACAFGFGTLATRLREKNELIERENERLAHLLRILPQGVVLMRADGARILSNPAAEALLARESFGNGLPESVRRRLSAFRGPREEFEAEYDGFVYKNVLARAAPGDPVVWVFQDITDELRLMTHLTHQSKMADIGLLAAGIAHEVGNPLSSMSAMLEVLEMKPVPPEVAGKLKAIGTHVERVAGIVRDVTTFARPGSTKRARFDLQQVLDKAEQIFRFHEKSKGLKLEVVKPQGEVLVDAVEDQILQVLVNLLLNAADACGEEGRVSIRVAEDEGEIVLSVSDDGGGLSDEARSHLFTPFFTTKEPGRGMGLGLFVTDSIVRGHGGRIEVDSETGKGSTFTVYLPAKEEGGDGTDSAGG